MLKNKLTKYLIILIFLINIKIQAQVAPASPIIQKVSINPITNCDSIIWHRSSSPDADFYVIGIADISNPFDPIHLDSIGVVEAPDSIFINCNTRSSIKSTGYSIVAYKKVANGVLPSGFNIPDSTIFLQVQFDSCKLEAKLQWNKYNKWKSKIKNHYVNIIKNNKVITIDTLDENILSYEYNKINEKDTISFFITTLNNDGLTSNSNSVKIYSNIKKRPEFISGNYVIKKDSKNFLIHFSIDPESEIEDLELYNSIDSTGNYEKIKHIKTNEKDILIETEVKNPDKINYFKLVALDECKNEIKSSNPICNLSINVINNNLKNIIKWNYIFKWQGNIDHYIIYRIIGENEYIDSFYISNNTCEYIDDISNLTDILNKVSNPIFCYQIKAVQKNHPYNLNYSMYSDKKCILIYPEPQIPNAFLPGNSSGQNNTFRPIFNYNPDKYILSIYTRWGNLIWQGSDAWDGKVNGSLVAEGVYIYNLKVYYKGKMIKEYTGTVAVIR